MSRNKRKSVTIVTGLDTYPELKLKDVAKALGKVFACGSSLSDTASGGKEIVIQGDVIDALADILVEKYNVSKNPRLQEGIDIFPFIYSCMSSPPHPSIITNTYRFQQIISDLHPNEEDEV